MALQIRRGLEAGRAAVTPAPGELLFTTDQTKLYIGDGATAGGTLVTGSGIGNLVEDVTPQLGGNLDVNGFVITSAGNGSVEINPDGTGNILLHGPVSIGSASQNIDGSLSIVKNNYSNAQASFSQHHSSSDASNFNFVRTRGTAIAQTTVVNGDDIADIVFAGHNGTAVTSGASLTVTVDGAPTVTGVPSKFSFLTNNGTAIAVRAELSSGGTWKTNSITALTTDQNLAIAANGTGSVGLDGTLFKANTMTMTPLSSQPTGVAGKIAVCDGTSWNGGLDGLQHLMIYINGVWTVVV